MTRPTLPVKKETFITGLPHGVSPAEVDALWEGSGCFRPRDQKLWLSHLISLEFGLARLVAGWVPDCGNLEWKIEMPQLLFEHMQRVRRLRERLQELPGGSGEIKPGEALAGWLGDLARADSGPSFFHVLFTHVYPALVRAYQDHAERCDEVFDAPTLYVLRMNEPEVMRAIARGRQFAALHPLAVPAPALAKAYALFIATGIARQGGLSPAGFSSPPAADAPAHPVESSPGPCPPMRRNDPGLRLRDGFPTSKEGNPTHGTRYEIVYHMSTEWQVIDPMCEIFHGMPGMPLDFFIDFARHTWDECRHARMGFRRLIELGYKIDQFEYSHTAQRTEVLEDYFAGLTMVGEACSFTRKKGSIPYFLKAGDPESAMLPETDCVDEQLHVTYGHRWVEQVYAAGKGHGKDRAAITEDLRASVLHNLLQDAKRTGSRSHGQELLLSLDADTREQLIKSFSGFCGLIEFKLDLTAR